MDDEAIGREANQTIEQPREPEHGFSVFDWKPLKMHRHKELGHRDLDTIYAYLLLQPKPIPEAKVQLLSQWHGIVLNLYIYYTTAESIQHAGFQPQQRHRNPVFKQRH